MDSPNKTTKRATSFRGIIKDLRKFYKESYDCPLIIEFDDERLVVRRVFDTTQEPPDLVGVTPEKKPRSILSTLMCAGDSLVIPLSEPTAHRSRATRRKVYEFAQRRNMQGFFSAETIKHSDTQWSIQVTRTK